MARKITLAVVIIACFLLQSTVFKALTIASVAPDLMIIVTSSFGFMRGRKEGLFVGFFCGLLLDIMCGSTLGFYALIYMFIGFINGFFRQAFYAEDIRLPMALITFSDFFCNFIVYFVLFCFRGRFSLGYYILHVMFPELIYTVIIALLLYFILLKINQKLEAFEKRREKKFV